MLVWILQTGEPLHCDGGNPRPMRAMNLADSLVERGHRVVLWSSDFNHQEKIARSGGFREILVSDRLLIRLIPSPGYTRNIGLGRLFDHFILGRNLRRELMRADPPPPDVIFVGFPPIEASGVMVDYAVHRSIPVVVDAKDQWPDVFLEPFPTILQPLVAFLLWPYFYIARRTFCRATALCSMSDEFLDWMRATSGRDPSALDFAAPLTSPKRDFPPHVLSAARKSWNRLNVDLDRVDKVVFVGSLSSAFDFSVILEVSRRTAASGLKCQFVVCGEGGESNRVRELLGGSENVVMAGWVDAAQIRTLFESSVALIAPYRSNDAFARSIPNKIIDALSFGCPILSTLDGKTARLVSDYELGCCSKDVSRLFSELEKLVSDRRYRSSVSDNSRRVNSEKFSYETVYNDVVLRLVELAR